jgi:hypothetical protein
VRQFEIHPFFKKNCGDKNLSLPLQNKYKIKDMPTLLNIFGLRFYFYSDEHAPVHVHIENSDGRAKINLIPAIETVENKGIKPKDIKKALLIIDMYKEEFIKAWHEYHEN